MEAKRQERGRKKEIAAPAPQQAAKSDSYYDVIEDDASLEAPSAHAQQAVEDQVPMAGGAVRGVRGSTVKCLLPVVGVCGRRRPFRGGLIWLGR